METFKDEHDFYQEGEEREEMDQFYKNHRNFGLRAKHELKRAERYCEFLSLLIVDLSSLSKFAKRGALKNYRRIEVLSQELEALIQESVRETDLVSGADEYLFLSGS